MTYLEHTIEMVNAFEDSCLCREIEQAEIDRMRNNEPLRGQPAGSLTTR
jgi:hypothetical protein